MKRPQTTILNLIDFGRDIGLGEALVPPENVRAIQASNRALYDDGRLTPEAVSDLAWREREWYFEGSIQNGENIGASKSVPQGGVLRLLTIHAKTPPSTGGCTFRVHAGGSSEVISLPKGESRNSSVNINIEIPPGDILTIDNMSAGGAKDVTVTAFIGGA